MNTVRQRRFAQCPAPPGSMQGAIPSRPDFGHGSEKRGPDEEDTARVRAHIINLVSSIVCRPSCLPFSSSREHQTLSPQPCLEASDIKQVILARHGRQERREEETAQK